jgi:hypothetical protein
MGAAPISELLGEEIGAGLFWGRKSLMGEEPYTLVSMPPLRSMFWAPLRYSIRSFGNILFAVS